MADYIIDAPDIIADFLRTYLTDPNSRSEDTNTETITATAGQNQITLSPPSGSVSCITSLTLNSTAKNKWKDYYWDYQNERITFYSALSLNDSVEITYKYGSTNWIYSDKPNKNLSRSSFPRISIFTISSPGKRLGQYNAPVESNILLQIDIWSKDGYVALIGGRKYSNDYLTRYLGNKITQAFEENEDKLFPVLYNYDLPSGVRQAPYSIEFQAYHSIVEVSFKGLRMGRIEK